VPLDGNRALGPIDDLAIATLDRYDDRDINDIFDATGLAVIALTERGQDLFAADPGGEPTTALTRDVDPVHVAHTKGLVRPRDGLDELGAGLALPRMAEGGHDAVLHQHHTSRITASDATSGGAKHERCVAGRAELLHDVIRSESIAHAAGGHGLGHGGEGGDFFGGGV